MATRKKELARDGYFGDLPNEIQNKIMNIHKLILQAVNEALKDHVYSDLSNDRWAKSMLDEFCTMPADKIEVGSVRVYKKGKSKYSCMIQATGHFANHMENWNQELMHNFIKNVFVMIRPKVRKLYDCTLKNEGENGEPFEGLDIWTSPKVAEELWNLFEDKTTRTITESEEFKINDADVKGAKPIPQAEINSFNLKSKHGEQLSFSMTANGKTTEYGTLDVKEESCGLDFIEDYEIFDEKFTEYEESKNENNDDSKKKQDEKVKSMIKSVINDKDVNRLKFSDLDKYTKESEQFTEGYIHIKNKYEKSKSSKDLPPKLRDKVLMTIDLFWYYVDRYIKECPDYFGFLGKGRLLSSCFVCSDKILNPVRIKTIFEKDDKNLESKCNAYTNLTPNFLEEYYVTDNQKKGCIHFDHGDYSYTVPYGVIYRINELFESALNMVCKNTQFNLEDTNKRLHIEAAEMSAHTFSTVRYVYEPEYSKLLYKYFKKPKLYPMNEAVEENKDPAQMRDVDMSPKRAKEVLHTLSASVINDKKDITQYTANIYSNIITKNLLDTWATGWRKFSITIDTDTHGILQFKIPSLSKDVVNRLINGRETINGFLHRNPEIKVRMSADIFKTMKDPDDAYNFFRSCITYYSSSVDKYVEKLTEEVMKMNHQMKHLISYTNLSGLVTYPIMLVFGFNNVKMTDPQTFHIKQDDIDAINNFVKNIYSRYASPEKEKKKIVDDVRKMVQTMRESYEWDENMREVSSITEAVNDYLFNKFDGEMNRANDKFIEENVNAEWSYHNTNPEIKYLQEKFGVKKLKKLPNDLVAYISIETEAIKDANDKMMISSYCLSKIEIVEWYIELLEVGSKKYIVPHSKPYLENLRTQLLACHKKIMQTPIPKADRPLISVNYPAGYEG